MPPQARPCRPGSRRGNRFGCPFPGCQEFLHGGLGSAPRQGVKVEGSLVSISDVHVVRQQDLVKSFCIGSVGGGSISLAHSGKANDSRMESPKGMHVFQGPLGEPMDGVDVQRCAGVLLFGISIEAMGARK